MGSAAMGAQGLLLIKVFCCNGSWLKRTSCKVSLLVGSIGPIQLLMQPIIK
jgi:hypothetical protein